MEGDEVGTRKTLELRVRWESSRRPVAEDLSFGLNGGVSDASNAL